MSNPLGDQMFLCKLNHALV